MKKKIIILVTISFMVVFVYQFFKQNSELSGMFDIAFANIESLAQTETGPNSWLQPETVRCKHELGGGWFESSVERICTFCAVPYSCTPVACGERF